MLIILGWVFVPASNAHEISAKLPAHLTQTALIQATASPTLNSNTHQQLSSNPDENLSLSNIKADENLIFFRTHAWLDSDAGQWHIPIHAWIYEVQNSVVRKKLFAKTLEKKYQLQASDETQANFSRRVNLMIADNERGKRVVIRLAGKYYPLAESLANGQIHDTIIVPVNEIETFLEQKAAAKGELAGARLIEFTAFAMNAMQSDDYRASRDTPLNELTIRDKRVFNGQSLLLPPQGVSVISDIDDTVKITQVTHRKQMLNNTFFNDFIAVPTIIERYQQWHEQGVSLHFVSSSPWQLYTPLIEFMAQVGFPWATLSLKTVRFKDSSLFDLFKKGSVTKPLQIEPILRRYPKREFILIGDSGEQDPEVYAGVYQRYPTQIKHIYIRNIANSN